MFSYTPTQIVEPIFLTTSNTTLYTVPTSAETVASLLKCSITNTSASAVTADIYLVPSGQTASDVHKVLDARSIASGETLNVPSIPNHVLESGDFIVAKASANSALSIVISANVGVILT